MNKTLLTLTFLTLATLPLAAAGPGASADTLEGDGASCTSDGFWWGDSGGDNDTWWSSNGASFTQSCADRFDYAAVEAHDDDGELASVSLSASHRNASRDGYGDHSYGSWDYTTGGWSWYATHEDAWSRDADVGTRAGDAGASYGCATASSNNQSSSWTYTSYGSWNSDARHSAYGDRCGVDADAADQHAFAGTWCRSASSQAGWSDTWGDSTREQDAFAGGDGCFTGIESDAATAGGTNGCSEQGFRRSETYWNGNESQSYGWSSRSLSCATGLMVVGPDGAVLFAGTESEEREDCDTDACYATQRDDGVVRLTWEHNPLQPGEQTLYAPLP